MNMKTTFIAAVASFLLVSTGTGSALASSLQDIEAASHILYSNGTPSCSSQVIESIPGEGSLVLTAGHCVASLSSKMSIKKSEFNPVGDVTSTTEYPLVIEKVFPKADLAILRTVDTEKIFPVVDLATSVDLYKGKAVIAAGFPGTQFIKQSDLVITDGRYVSTRPSLIAGSNDMYRVTVPIWYGNSGGGLYVSTPLGYELIGVTSQIDPSYPWATSFFSPLEEIKKALEDVKEESLGETIANAINEAL